MEKRYLVVQELNLVQPTTMQTTYVDAKAIYDAHEDLNIWLLMHTPGVEHFWRLFNKNYVQLSFNGEVPWLGSDSTKEVEMFAILRGLL